MLFNSQVYFVFLPAVILITWGLPPRLRPVFLLGASYLFYAYWNPPFLLLIAGLTGVNYWIGRAQGRLIPKSAFLLTLGIALDLGALGVFKYLGLLDESARRLAALFGLPPAPGLIHLILPLGLSFFTFEFIHYQVDVFRGSQPIRSPIRFALFPAFFPTQIAGPIKRYQDFDGQVGSQPRFDSQLALEGIELIALGLFKKVALADNLLPIANLVFADPLRWGWRDSWIGLLSFSFQIYLDFSGYTDIGRGSAQLLGYRIPINFQAPYLAGNLRDFWRRWHISLSSWLRDYIYIPLGGSRLSRAGTRLNLLITMGLGGLWHGAAWHFVTWGLGHGTALALNREGQQAIGRRIKRSWMTVIFGWALTQASVLFLWAFFRSPSSATAVTLLRHLFALRTLNHLANSQVRTALLIAGGVLAAQLVIRHWHLRQLVERRIWSVAVRPAYVFTLVVVSGYFGVVNGLPHRFIYFQF